MEITITHEMLKSLENQIQCFDKMSDQFAKLLSDIDSIADINEKTKLINDYGPLFDAYKEIFRSSGVLIKEMQKSLDNEQNGSKNE